jgi:3-dehydroquinate synthase
MKQQTYSFSSASTTCYFDADISLLDTITDPGTTIVVTDENVYRSHANHFQGRKTIVIKAGERFKTQDTVNEVIKQLISYKADRKFFIVGIGGGVVTDVTGYTASVYMRGLRFGFVPVSLLAMVDASIGGKNGVDVGPYKNLVGTIRQPEFLLYDSTFLQTLPRTEWVNGFAEIIKHACIKDGAMFDELEQHNIDYYIGNKHELDRLISRNAMIKAGVVIDDEFEKGERRLLNFGHTWGHAIETKLNIPHGHAVSIGMVVAAELSELSGFSETERIRRLLRRYELPVDAAVDRSEVFSVLAMDKKRDSNFMNYVLLNSIGEATVKKIPLDELEKLIIR